MSLPLARSTNDNELRFNTQSLVRAKEVASTPSAVDYLLQTAEILVDGCKDSDKHKMMLDNLYEHQVKITRLGTRDSAMTYENEKQVRNDHDNYQYRTALDSVKTLTELTKPDTPIKLGYAVNAESMVKRFYLQDEVKMGKKASEASDEFLNAFLSQHELITKDGVIFDYDSEEKDIAKDDNGNSIRADTDKIVKVISNPENSADYDPNFKSFKDYASELSRDKLKFETKQYAYPTPQATAEVSAEVKAPEPVAPVTPEVITPEPVDAPTPVAETEVDPETSTPGSDRSM